MNKHILLVMRWLNDKDSVTQEELEKNKYVTAHAARMSAIAACTARCPWVSATYASAVHCAMDAASDDNYVAAAHWVKQYFILHTDEDRTQYKKELEK